MNNKKEGAAKGISPVVLVGLAVVVVAGAGVAWYAQGQQNSTKTTATPTPSAGAKATATPTATPAPTPFAEAGVTWLAAPVKLADLKLYVYPEGYAGSADETSYYHVGDYNGRDIVLTQLVALGLGGPDSELFLKDTGSKGTYTLLTTYNKAVYAQNSGGAENIGYAGIVTANNTVTLQSVAQQTTLKVKGANLDVGTVTGLFSIFAGDSFKQSAQPVDTTPYGPVYSFAKTLDDGTAIYYLVLRRFDGTAVTYTAPTSAVLNDSMVASVTWKDGAKNADTYRIDGGGACGRASGVNVVASPDLSLFTQVGTTAAGKAVYEYKDTNNAVTKGAYAMLNDGKYFDTKTGESITISYADFLKKHPVILTQDPLGNMIVLRNSVYGSQAECGKPVVYLYPTKDTQVSVKVGASITKSEPAYNGGWNVLAKPNGALTTAAGKSFGNLFWEGLGNGTYPTINSGVVVKGSEAAATLKQQLVQLGLNKQEQSDFLDFWLPKLPTTPYVRLSWLGTADMNRLAPLEVTPKPDTVIRVFLDFEGLQQSVSLPAQHLSARARNGFTVVEWGGLLR
ncbi:MAG: hypothetical protein WCO52_05575 [bacterium]